MAPRNAHCREHAKEKRPSEVSDFVWFNVHWSQQLRLNPTNTNTLRRFSGVLQSTYQRPKNDKNVALVQWLSHV